MYPPKPIKMGVLGRRRRGKHIFMDYNFLFEFLKKKDLYFILLKENSFLVNKIPLSF